MSDDRSAEYARVAAWLKDAANTRELDWIREYVVRQWDALFARLTETPEPALTAAPAPGEWSALQAFQHLVEWNWQVGEDILHVCLMGERPGNPAPSFPLDRLELAARARESLESIWAHVSAAEPTAFLDLTWEHPFFGPLNWREWYLFLAIHVMDHTAQIKDAVNAANA